MKLFASLRQEWHAFFGDGAVLLIVFGGVLLYSFLYPLPYLRQTPRDLPVIVVNLDNSQTSRRLEHLVDASPSVRLAARAGSLDEAERLLVGDKLAGILVIPENFSRDLLLGRRPTLTLAGDAGFFLVYGKVVEGMGGAAKALTAELAEQPHPWKKPTSGQGGPGPAIGLDLAPLFNPGMGYLGYVIPAVYLLILHQTLVIGIGLVSAGWRGRQLPLPGAAAAGAALLTLMARATLFVGIYWLLALYYFGASFELYHIPHLGNPAELHLLLAPFLFAAAFLGICLGLLLPRREVVTLVVLVSSMPLIFLAGFIWPPATIPSSLTALGQAIPVLPAISAYLALNHLGADFPDISRPFAILCLQAMAYGTLAWYLLWRDHKTKKPPEDR